MIAWSNTRSFPLKNESDPLHLDMTTCSGYSLLLFACSAAFSLSCSSLSITFKEKILLSSAVWRAMLPAASLTLTAFGYCSSMQSTAVSWCTLPSHLLSAICSGVLPTLFCCNGSGEAAASLATTCPRDSTGHTSAVTCSGVLPLRSVALVAPGQLARSRTIVA